MTTPRSNVEILPRAVQVALAAGFACLLALPATHNDFYVQMATRMAIMAIFAMSFDLLQGVTGMVSQGHAAFFGLGGYALAFLTPATGALSLWWSLPASMVAMALLAGLIGLVTLKTRGIYFIMATLAVSEMIFHLFFDNKSLGGSDGLYIAARPTLLLAGRALLDLEDYRVFYFFVLAVMAAVFFLLRRLLFSPYGRVLAGVRVNEHRMRSMGYNTPAYKLSAFAIGGSLAGLAGYLFGMLNGLVSPELIGFQMSAVVLMMVVIGGGGNFAGAIIGAFCYELMVFCLKDLPVVGSVDLGKRWQLGMGIFIVLVIAFAPRGLLGAAHSLLSRKKS